MSEALISVLAGLVGVPLVQYLKGKLGWSGDKVKLLAAVVAGVLAVGGLAVTGQLFPIGLDNLAGRIALAFTVGQLLYALLPKS